MKNALLHLNYFHVLVVGVAGFMVGAIWYSFLFGKAWMQEMKITEERMKQSKEKGMAAYMIKGFLYTLLGTFGLATLLTANGPSNWLHGAAYGAFVGLFVSVARQLNSGVWEERSLKLQAINAGHELALFTLQGALLGGWH